MNIIIRQETISDIQAITDVTIAAFRTVEISNKTEQFIINALRKEDALSISLVAEFEDQIVGHVAFSPVTISDGSEGWYGLGPVSVLPDYQRQGIGKEMITKGLSMLQDMDAYGCVLVGGSALLQAIRFYQSSTIVTRGSASGSVFGLVI